MTERHGRTTRRALAAGAALLLAFGALAPALAAASTLNGKIRGTISRRRGVAIEIAGANLGTQARKVTNRRGVAKFPGIPGDVYTVTPSKLGFRFTPAQRLVALPEGAALRASFRIAPLPAVGALTASTTDLVLPKTLSATVVVTATDGAGNGIEGATIAAASSDELYVAVSPASAVTDALGTATFTLTAFGSIAYAAGAAPLALPTVALETVTFTSGGWRGTPVRTAQTAVTVQQALEAALWLSSGHADANGEPFTHWDADGAIPTTCARCHSRPGFLDYAADGVVDAAAPLGTTVDCMLCHDPAAMALDTVTFPSNAADPAVGVVSGLGHEAICMTCHQGRESGLSVEAKLAGKPEDTIDGTIRFTNIHYYAAAATLYGTVAKGGYEYAGARYDRKFTHVSALDTCYECHDQHSLALRLEVCVGCHGGATDYAGVKTIRMAASTQDYDGDGDLTEGVARELEGLAALLYQTIQAYAAQQGFPIVYDGHTYPYFLEAGGGGYAHFTPRLLKACYNYQVYQKDPGSHAHSAKYMVELLHDSIQDLAAQLPGGAVAGIARNDLNHFDTTREAFRHWDADADGLVNGTCARCHSGEAGFRFYIENGFVNPPNTAPASRMSCETCHTGTGFGASPPRRYVSQIVFPSPAADPTVVVNDPLDPDDSFICMTCHQGRESKKTIDAAIVEAAAPAAPDDDTAYAALSFKNVHYLSAGASLYGKQAGVGYEYPGKTYDLKFNHWGGDSPRCFYCHDVSGSSHTFLPRLAPVCGNCHTEIVGGDITTIRLNRPYDYDGDGNTTERLVDEIHALRDALYAALRAYARGLGTPVAYSQTAYPYFFEDPNDNGVVDAGEAGFASWTPRLLKAAHNFQMAYKEPGDWAHNTNYTAQVMIDSIENLGGNVSAYQRPVGF